jgi:hypothetical protein
MASAEMLALAQRELGYDTNPTLAEAEYQIDQLGRAPEGERSFLANISEAFSRGQTGVLADIAVYEAMTSDNQDVTGALIARKKLQTQSALDPVEGRYVTSLVYAAANTAGQVLESGKRAARGSVIGGLIGGAVGALGGAVIPTIGEEPFTIGAGLTGGAKLGAKIGGHGDAGMFMYRQGAGAMYADMIEEGIDPAIAKKAAQYGAVPYALIEMAQFKLLGKAAKSVGVGKVKSLIQAKVLAAISKGVGKYALTLGGEVTEEVAQEIVQIATSKAAEAYQEGGLSIDQEFIDESLQRIWSVTKGAGEAFALLPVPGAALEAGVAYQGAILDAQMANSLDQVAVELSPMDMSNPEVQFTAAMNQKLAEATKINPDLEAAGYKAHVERANKAGKEAMTLEAYQTRYRSNQLFREQEVARAEERRERLGRGLGDIRGKSNAAEYMRQGREYLKDKTYTTLEIGPLEGSMSFEKYTELQEKINAATDKVDNAEALRLMESLKKVYFEGGKFQKSDWKVAAKIFGPNTVSAMEAISTMEKPMAEGAFTQTNNYLRSMASAVDMSATLRQNKFTISHPKTFAKLLAVQAKILAKGLGAARILDKDMWTSEIGQASLKHGIDRESFNPGAGFEHGSERFPSTDAGRVPGVARSQAAYTVAGNLARVLLFGEIWLANKDSMTDKQLNDIARIINIMTGRGSVKWLGEYAPVLNSMFFAPRNFTANVQVWTELFNPELSGVARKYLAFNLVKWIGINAGVIGMLSMVPGVDVEPDPRSTDWGKVVIGNQHIDFWGGQLPLVRTVLRLATGTRKTTGGQIVDAGRVETITRFLQNKLGPLPSFALDMMRGETSMGEKRSLMDPDQITKEAYEKLVPFFAQDIADAARLQGWNTAPGLALSFLGASSQTYVPTKSSQGAMRRNELAREVLGVTWDELGPEVQKFLRAKFPEIGDLEREAKYEREDNNFMSKIEKDIKKSQAFMNKTVPEDVRRELAALQVTLGGVSRRVGTNWYLNDVRFKQYQDTVADAYKTILPKLMRSPMWSRLNQAGRVEMVVRVTAELKEAARKKIIVDANLSDLQRRQYGAVKQ